MVSDDEDSQGVPAIHVTRQNGPPQSSSSSSLGGTSELAAGLSRWMDASKNFVYVELASVVLLVACAADWYSTAAYKYALAVSCVSLVVCLIMQTTEFLIPGFLEWSAIKREDGTGTHSVQKVISSLMLVWWIVGTGIITFRGPFTITGNGWFGAWGGLLATVKWCASLKSSLYADKPEGLKQLYNISLCSVVLIFASIPPLVRRRTVEHYAGAAFSMTGAAVTLLACAYLAVMYSDVARSSMKVATILFFALWTCIAGVCTFHGPFLVTNNGFFATWLGCLSSLTLMLHEMKNASPENYV